jgi:hypothetical protein
MPYATKCSRSRDSTLAPQRAERSDLGVCSESVLSHHLDELAAQGYAVLSGIYSSEDIRVFRSTLEAIYDEFGRPLLTTVDKADLGRGCLMSASGLAIGRLLDHAPELAPRMLHPEVRAVLRGALGPQVEAEVIAGVVSDHHRSMHPWHTHIGGPDEDIVDPSVACSPLAIRRVSLLVYLDDLEPGAGQLMIYPRRQSDPVVQPFEDERAQWDGHVLLSCPAGTAVVIEERTWHAATTRTFAGFRMFVGGQFVSSAAIRASRADPALPGFHGELFG